MRFIFHDVKIEAFQFIWRKNSEKHIWTDKLGFYDFNEKPAAWVKRLVQRAELVCDYQLKRVIYQPNDGSGYIREIIPDCWIVRFGKTDKYVIVPDPVMQSYILNSKKTFLKPLYDYRKDDVAFI